MTTCNQNSPSVRYHLDSNHDGCFVIENYNHSKIFTNFFPGVAGLWGIPMWVFKANFEGFEFCQANFKSTKKDSFVVPDEFKVINLINGYRQRGHLFTKTNPVRTRRKYMPTLDIANAVRQDLRRIAILAGALAGIMILLSIFI